MVTASVVTRERRLGPITRSSILAGIVTLFVDSYDIYLPALVLPAALGYFEPATMSDTVKATLDTVVFTVTLLGRPIGGPIFGHLADRIGRRRVAIIAGAGFTVITGLIACLPGYRQWGYGAIGALIGLRLLGGILLGGGYAGPVPLAIERTPKRLRGPVGGLVASGAPAALIFIALIQLLALDHQSPSAFETWGWRIPFGVGVLLGIAYLWYLRHHVTEIDMEQLQRPARATAEPAPSRAGGLGELIRGPQLRTLVLVVMLMTGMWFAAQMTVSFLPVVLITVLHQAPTNVSWYEVVSSAIGAVAMLVYGVAGQRYGRRATLRAVAVSIIVGESAAWLFMVRFAEAGAPFVAVAAMATIASVLAGSPLGVFIVYLNERFGTRVRSSGYSVAYTFGLILPGLYTVWVKGLAHIVPFAYTALFLIPLGGVLVFAAVTLGPETNDVTLLDDAEAQAASERASRPTAIAEPRAGTVVAP